MRYYNDDVNFNLYRLLIYTATVTPYNISFVDEENMFWYVLDLVIDGLFFIDIIVNCFSSYFDEEYNIITNHKQILINYAKG